MSLIKNKDNEGRHEKIWIMMVKNEKKNIINVFLLNFYYKRWTIIIIIIIIIINNKNIFSL